MKILLMMTMLIFAMGAWAADCTLKPEDIEGTPPDGIEHSFCSMGQTSQEKLKSNYPNCECDEKEELVGNNETESHCAEDKENYEFTVTEDNKVKITPKAREN